MDVTDTRTTAGAAATVAPTPPRSAAIVRPSLRVVTIASAVLLLAQPVLAGQSLDGNGAAMRLHVTVGVIFLGVAILQDIVSILWWKPAGGAGWVPVVAVTSHLLGLVQMELGHARSFGFHLPVGIALVLLAGMLLVGAWTELGQRRGPR